MVSRRNFEEERERAKLEAWRLTAVLQGHGYEVGAIDWERAGLLAYVPVNGVQIDSLMALAGYEQRDVLLKEVRLALLEAAARQHLQQSARAVSWAPLEIPPDAPSEIQSLWRVHLGENEQPGINIAEVLRHGRRTYEYYAGGPQFGVHSFYVDTISPRVLQLIHAAGGSVTYHPQAQRADDVRGRRQVQLPEGSHQRGESDEFMAPQRFRLPDGSELRMGMLWLNQDEHGRVKLSPRAQYDLLEFLYKRRYALYHATHLSLGANDAPDWIRSGYRATRIIDAEQRDAE